MAILKEKFEEKEMDPMELGEYQESIREDFTTLTEMFENNFSNLDVYKLEQFRVKVRDLINLLSKKGGKGGN